MRSQKVLNGLNATPSQIKRNLKYMKPTGYNMDIDEMLVQATMKLRPIIDVLMATPNAPDHFISIRECDDIEQVARIVKDASKSLENIGFAVDIKPVALNMQKYRRRANTDGSIYVDTTLLVGILELHKILEGIKEDLESFYRSIGIHSFAQTESGLDSLPTSTESSYNSNKIVFKLKRPATRGGSFALLKNEFILMPSTTEIPLTASQSQILQQDGSSTSPRRSRSDISFDNERITGVTDAYGARHLLVKCIYDLKGVSEYLGTPRRDAFTVYTMDLDEDQEDEDEGGPFDDEEPQFIMGSLKETSSNTEPVNITSPVSSQASVERSAASPTSIKSVQQEERKSTPKTSLLGTSEPVHQVERMDDVPVGTTQKCCCPECYAEARRADEALGECDEDAVIICIKGCHEDEGDIQIVIRQCPDCKASSSAKKDQPIQPPPPPPPVAPVAPAYTPPVEPETPSPPKRSTLEPVPSQPSAESVTSALRRSVAESITSEPRKSSVSQASRRRSTIPETGLAAPPAPTSPRASVAPPSSPRGSVSSREESPRQSILSAPRRSTPPELSSPPRRSTPPVIATPPQQSATDFDYDQPDIYGLNEEEKFDDTESVTLHNKDSQGSLVCSDDEEGEEGEKLGEEGELTEKNLKNLVNYTQDQGTYSKIRLYETTNLCLETNTGEELVISLTVTPKDLSTGGANPISLTDIFSDNEEVGQRTRQRSSSQARKTVNYYVPDKYIPLGRTKICSSLEFDVTTAESKIRSRGIKNKNNKILVQLQDFGTDNLLRACRPAKCCRKAVLNEKMKKCLPYAASIRSLPLDDDDMDVINQSLQMSLQKVKNSTNLQKEFYANQVYLVSPVNTVQFCHLNSTVSVEDVKKLLVKQKLQYYIELELDKKVDKVWEVYYFEQLKPQSKNHSNGGVGDPVASRPSNLMRQGSGYTGKVAQNHSSLIRSARKTVEGEDKNKDKRKTKPSRIPIFCGLKKLNPRIDKSQHVHDLNNCSESPTVKNNPLYSDCSASTSVAETCLAKLDSSKVKLSVTWQSLGESLSRFAQDNSSNSSIVIRRTKKKKKEFYLSRSRSEISLKGLQKLSRSKMISAVSRTTQVKKESTSKELVSVNSLPPWKVITEDPEASKIVLNYFAKLLYDMVMIQMIHEAPRLMDKGVATENKSLKELYRKSSKQRPLDVNLPKFGVKIPYHNLKAKQSQYCIMPSNQRNLKNYYLLNTLALQTSRILGDSKICQTSSTLLAYFFQPNLEQTRILRKLYSLETGQSSSCDEIVTVNSRAGSGNISESDPDDSLGRSLVKLKQTLEKYEHMKEQINKKCKKQSAINPIEYFVYHQACACSSANNNHNNKPEKKQSLIQKILNKTKELFSSPEKDMCRKYKNQTEYLSMTPEERDLCYNCGCSITQCASELSPETTDLVDPLVCSCPEETKPKPKTSEPCCKKFKGICNFSKMSSNASMQSLKTHLRRNSVKAHQKTNGEELGVIEMCVDERVQVVQCEKKSAGTHTTKDSGTQKCECGKCENFAEDGTCCCSHCLGCLDKSFEAKPANHTVGVVTETSKMSQVETASKAQNNSLNTTNTVGVVTEASKISQVKTASKTQSDSLSKTRSDRNSLTREIYSEKRHSEAGVSTSILMEPVHSQPEEDSNIEKINTETIEEIDTNHNASATFFFVAPPPHMFQHLSGSNPFDQCRFNMPPFFHMERSPDQ